MKRIFNFAVHNPKTIIAAFLLAAFAGFRIFQTLSVDVFPDISVPRVTIQTEAGGLTADEVTELVTIPIESAVNGIPGVTKVRSSSSGGLSFVWVDFDWNADLTRARFDVFERLSRIKDALPDEAHAEISPLVSVTGEIMLIALTAKDDSVSDLEIREIAEYDLRTRLLGVPGIGEVAVMGAKLPEFRVAVDPMKAAERNLSLPEIIEAAQSTRTYSSAGYLQNSASEEVPVNQIARADTLDALKKAPIPLAEGGSIRLGDVAEVSVQGEPRRGSASFNGKSAVVLSVQKSPGGNTPELTKALNKVLEDFSNSADAKGIEITTDAYRQADFIAKSIDGGKDVARDAAIIVIIVLLVTLLELRTIIIVLATMPISVLMGLLIFPPLGLGVNVMTLGGFAVAIGDIVDAAIIFTEVIRRKLAENDSLDAAQRKPLTSVIVNAAHTVAPSVLFSALTVVVVFIPLLLLSGLEGKFFKPLALSYVSVFAASLVVALMLVPALAIVLRPGCSKGNKKSDAKKSTTPLGVRVMVAIYRPLLNFAIKFPKTILLLSLCAVILAGYLATSFGSSFLPPFKEDSYNVMLSLPPGASLEETERVSEACVPALRAIPGVLSVTRRTGRAERDQHAEPVSSSEFVVRVDLDKDTEEIKRRIREELGSIPGASLVVGYPIAHRISAVLSGSEAELAINIYGENLPKLRKTAEKIKQKLDTISEVTDVRANREITVRTLKINYDLDALAETGITLKEAGEQVSAALNGAKAGEVRNGIKRRSVTVRLAGDESKYDEDTVRSLIISARNGKRVRLDQIAEIVPVEASNLLLREGSRQKILITANPAPGANIGDIVKKLDSELKPIAIEDGATIEFGGSYLAKESATKTLTYTGIGIAAFLFIMLVFALGSAKSAALALINIPLGLIGAVVAVKVSGSVLSVSSLVGLMTVVGFLVRNGILLLNVYQEKISAGETLENAIRIGSLERMIPIILTSATTVIGLIPIILSGTKPGGELLAPLAIVQFGGLVGATFLNLIVLPSAVKTFGIGKKESL